MEVQDSNLYVLRQGVSNNGLTLPGFLFMHAHFFENLYPRPRGRNKVNIRISD